MNSLLVKSFTRHFLHPSRQTLRQWPTIRKVLVPSSHQFNRLSSTRSASEEPRHSDYEPVFDAEFPYYYKKGGRHPVHIGDVFQNRYQVVNKLGITRASLIWLAYDLYLKQWVALKIRDANSKTNNTEILRALATSTPSRGSHVIPQILDEFQIIGPNGTHLCSTRAAALGTVKDSFFSCYQFPHDVARAVAYELTIAIAHMHAQGYMHGEIDLQNVLVKARPEFSSYSISEFVRDWGAPESEPVELKNGGALPVGVPSVVFEPLGMEIRANDYTLKDANIVLCGFGSAFSPAKEQRLGRDYLDYLDYQPPEAIFLPDEPLTFSADVWSLALAIWDILALLQLFPRYQSDNDNMLFHMLTALGPLPLEWPEKWDNKGEYYDEQGKPVHQRGDYFLSLEEAFERAAQRFLRKSKREEYPRTEVALFLDLMRQMLKYRPEERPTLEEVLKSEWMVRWAGPAYERKQAMNASSAPLVPFTTK